MKDADAIGTVGSADCGDMLRMWIKFKEEEWPQSDRSRDVSIVRMPDGDRGGERGDGNVERQNGGGSAVDVGRGIGRAAGPLPPVKIHCAQLVEGALRSAVIRREKTTASQDRRRQLAPTLHEQLAGEKKKLEGGDNRMK